MGRLRGNRPVDIEGTGKVSRLPLSQQRRLMRLQGSNTHALSIKVDTETHRVNDDGTKVKPLYRNQFVFCS